jgi:YfiH family protein
MVELKQVHADTLRFSSQITPGISDTPGTEGDGIILDQKQTVAIIKTADCTPLFFWDKGGAVGGVVHIGWKGLLKGIERKLLEVLREKFPVVDLGRLNFYLGPSIERKCYEVGPDLYEAFSIKTYRDKIFYPFSPGTAEETNSSGGNHLPRKAGATEPGSRKYRMDVKKGIRLSLKEGGIKSHQIRESGLCTFCEVDRLPSYRRSPEIDGRIYNFLVLK